MSADLSEDELNTIKTTFELFETDGTIDATLLGTSMRVLNLNPSLETLEKMGATEKKGEKKIKLEELCKIYNELKQEKKEQGCYEDFVECCKLYDKAEDGKMLTSELQFALLSLGEKLTDKQVDELFDDCLPEEDDEGQIEYRPLLAKMCNREAK